MYHLYEVVLESPQMWLKIQASCSSEEQATAFFGSRFGGNDPDPVSARSPLCVVLLPASAPQTFRML